MQRTTHAALIAALAASLLSACQSYAPDGIKPGTTVAQVQAGMGAPTATFAMPDGGRRLEYRRGPYGKHTYMIDVDATGRVLSATQVLTEAQFARIALGQSRDEVLRAIGHPSDVKVLGWQNRMLWSYRYDAVFCTWYQVSFDTEWKVVDTGYGPDPMCDRDEREW